MFLFDPTFGASFENCEAEIRRLMERAGAEIVFCRRWDERRLSFKLKGRKRGLYVLVYFKGPADKITGLERDCQISENILRVLVIRADGVTQSIMEKFADARGADTTGDPAGAKRGGPGAGEPEGFVPPPLDSFGDFNDYDNRRGGRRGGGGGGGGRKPAIVEAPKD